MSDSFLIQNARVVLPGQVAEGWSVLCEEGRIVRAGPDAELAATAGMTAPAGMTVIDAQACHLAPGLIDLHIHGAGDFLVDDGPSALAALSRLLPRWGVTGFLPAVLPRPSGEDARFLAGLSRMQAEGAAILGFLLEGPFLSLTGALPKEALGQADPARVRALVAAAAPYRAVFAISPDFAGITGLLPLMTADGAPAFITHTRADAVQTQAAIAAGARHATHFYDVFYAPEERDPGVRPCGVVEAVLADPRVSVDFILDGEHVDPLAVKMALACKGLDGVCLITDANRGAGGPPGRFNFGGHEIEFAHAGAPARFTKAHPENPGTLAGSGLTLDRAVRNAIQLLGVDLPAAIAMASANPARVLGLAGRKGRIAEGYDADLVLFDRQLKPAKTWIGGVCRYDAEQA